MPPRSKIGLSACGKIGMIWTPYGWSSSVNICYFLTGLLAIGGLDSIWGKVILDASAQLDIAFPSGKSMGRILWIFLSTGQYAPTHILMKSKPAFTTVSSKSSIFTVADSLSRAEAWIEEEGGVYHLRLHLLWDQLVQAGAVTECSIFRWHIRWEHKWYNWPWWE